VDDAKLKNLPAAIVSKLSNNKLQQLGIENHKTEKVTLSIQGIELSKKEIEKTAD